MCRYGWKIYKPHFACFRCRKVFKKAPIQDYLKQKELLDVYYKLLRAQRDAKGRQAFEEHYGVTLVELEGRYSADVGKCPQCGGEMADLGYDFRAPKQRDVKAWRMIEQMFELGHVFRTCGCNGFGYVPKGTAEYAQYLQDRLQDYQASFRLAVDGKGIDAMEKDDAMAYWSERITLIERELQRAAK